LSFDARRYTIDGLIKQLLLLELHIRDGSVWECGCAWDAHLPLIEGLAEEGIKFAKDEKEREFFDRLMHWARDARLRLQYGLEGEGMEVEEHSNPAGEVRVGEEYVHETLQPEDLCDPRSFRTVKSGEHRVVVCCPKGGWDESLPEGEQCRVGMQAQKILHPIWEKEEEELGHGK